MYIVNLTYNQPLSCIDEKLEQHLVWLQQQFDAGHFLCSGPKVPRTGGVILVKDMHRDHLETILKQDILQSVADYEIIEVDFVRTHPNFNF